MLRRLVRTAAFLLAGIGVSACGAQTSQTRTTAAEAVRPLTLAENESLARGETVIREQTWENADHRYVGGFTYTVLDTTPAELWAVLEDVSSYRRLLPKTKRANVVGTEGRDQLVELVQGNSLVQAEYTVRFRSDPEAREVKFWLEPSRPHQIDDAYGFFRIEPFIAPSGAPRVLLTYGVVVDVGPGLVRELFEERVRTAMLSVPQLVRRYVAEARRTN